MLYRSPIRHKSQCINHTIIPAPFSCGSPTIIIRSPYSVKLKPIDPVEFGDVKAVSGYLYLETETDEEMSAEEKRAFQRDIHYEVKAVWTQEREFVEVSCSRPQKFQYPSEDISLHFQVPVHYSVEIEAKDEANVCVSGLEGKQYEIITDQGSCELKNLKGSRLIAETEGGDLKSDSLLFWSGILGTKQEGRILVKKLQGTKFCLYSEDGDIDVGAMYLVRAELASKGGQVKLGDIHGSTEIDVDRGDISVVSASGKLKAVTTTGNVNVNLSYHDDVMLKSKEGNVSVKTLEESVFSKLKVKSKSINIDPSLNLVKTEEDAGENFIVLTAQFNPKQDEQEQTRTITAEAKLGSVKLEKNDWFSQWFKNHKNQFSSRNLNQLKKLS